MLTLAQIQDEVKDELGTDLVVLFSDIDTLIERWANRGQNRLDYQFRMTDTLSWAVSATEITLPLNFYRWGSFLPDEGAYLPKGHEVNGVYVVSRDGGAVAAGTGRLLYWARPQEITDANGSELPPEGDTALIAFCHYSFFKRLATSRSDYERYATISGQNGVDLEEIRTLAGDHLDEYREAKDNMPRQPSVTFYGS